MSIEAIIVDDHQNRENSFKGFCESYSNGVIQIAAFPSVDTALVAIKTHKPDLVFLDIDMPEKNGFELINNFDVLPLKSYLLDSRQRIYKSY
jgi:two-component system LytT family response regulator